MSAIERTKEIIGNDVTVENIEKFIMIDPLCGRVEQENGTNEFLRRVQCHLRDGSPLPPWPVTKLPFELIEPCVEILDDRQARLEYDIYDLETFNALKDKIIHTWVEVDGIAPEACREFNGFAQFEDCWTADPTIKQLENYFKIILDK